MTAAISFESVTKTFTLQHARPRSFKEAFVARLGSARPPPEVLVALDAVSFEVAEGHSMGLVGPNGTGKSTVLKLAAGILEPNAGVVRVSGRVAALLELGAGFHPELTGRENVYLNGSILGLDRKTMSRSLDKIIDFSELGRFIDMPVKHYSSGMYMRLGFATAIHVEPRILLIDEVLAVGDQAFQAKCRERIAALRRDGVTIVLVSHDIQATRELCDSAVWLESGQVRAAGTTDDVVEAYYRSIVEHEQARFEAESAGTHRHAERDRWGSGEVLITAVDVLGADGQPHAVAVTGEPATIRLFYTANVRVERPVFGIGIHRQDGVHVAGPNTRDDGLEIAAIEGDGLVTFHIPVWPLAEGTYELSASAYDWGVSEPFDYHHRRHILRVRAGHLGERHGLIHMSATWNHASGVEEPRAAHTP